MSPNGLSVWLPAWNRGISLRARTGFENTSPCRELITSVPHRPPEKGASIQFQGSRSLRFHGASERGSCWRLWDCPPRFS